MPPVLQDAVKLSGSLKRTTRGCKPCKHERPSVHRFNANRAAIAALRGLRPLLRFTGHAPLQRGFVPLPRKVRSFCRMDIVLSELSHLKHSEFPPAKGKGEWFAPVPRCLGSQRLSRPTLSCPQPKAGNATNGFYPVPNRRFAHGALLITRTAPTARP